MYYSTSYDIDGALMTNTSLSTAHSSETLSTQDGAGTIEPAPEAVAAQEDDDEEEPVRMAVSGGSVPTPVGGSDIPADEATSEEEAGGAVDMAKAVAAAVSKALSTVVGGGSREVPAEAGAEEPTVEEADATAGEITTAATTGEASRTDAHYTCPGYCSYAYHVALSCFR